MNPLKEIFLSDEIIENAENAIEVLERRLYEYSCKKDVSKEYVLNQRNLIKNLKEYFIHTQQYIAQLERKAPIQNFITYANQSIDNSDIELKRENQQMKKQINLLEKALNYHCITRKDIDFLVDSHNSKETIRQASINKAKQEMPNLF